MKLDKSNAKQVKSYSQIRYLKASDIYLEDPLKHIKGYRMSIGLGYAKAGIL